MNKCYYCGGNVVWDSDFSFEDECLEGEGIVQFYHCSECGAEIEVRIPFEEGDEA